MSSAKGRMLSLLGGLVLVELPVTAVVSLSPWIRLVRLGPRDPAAGLIEPVGSTREETA